MKLSSLLFLCCACEVQGIDREKPAPLPTKPEPVLSLVEPPAPCTLTGEQRISFSLWQDSAQVEIKEAVATLRPAPFSLWLCFHQDGDVAINASLSDALLQYASRGGPLLSASVCAGYDARCDTLVSKGGLMGPFDGSRTFAHSPFHSGRDLLLADDSVNSYYYSAPDDYDLNEVKVQDGVVTGRVDFDIFWPVEQPERRPISALSGQSLYLVFMGRNDAATVERQRGWLTLQFRTSKQ